MKPRLRKRNFERSRSASSRPRRQRRRSAAADAADQVGQRHGDEIGGDVDEERAAGDGFEGGLGGEGEQEDGEEHGGAGTTGGALATDERNGQEHEQGRVEPREAPIAAQLRHQPPERDRDQERRRGERRQGAHAAEPPAESRQQDEDGEIPGEVVGGPVRPMAGRDPPRLAGAEPPAVVLEPALGAEPEQRHERRQAEQERGHQPGGAGTEAGGRRDGDAPRRPSR